MEQKNNFLICCSRMPSGHFLLMTNPHSVSPHPWLSLTAVQGWQSLRQNLGSVFQLLHLLETRTVTSTAPSPRPP